MKKLFLFSALPLLLCASLMACQQDDTVLPVEPMAPDTEQIDPEYRAILTAWGFDGDDMVAHEDGYIVEGDVFFSHEQLEEAKSKTRQNYYGETNKIHAAYHKIELNLYASFSQDKKLWDAAFKDAAAAWSAVDGCAIEITTSYATSAINVWEQIAGNSFGLASMPNNGHAGSLYVNAKLFARNYPSDYNGNQRRMVAVHLLGHCLGLAHTTKAGNITDYQRDEVDENGAYTGDGTHIEDTPQTDDNSVMNHDAYGRSFNHILGLSDGDKLAIRTLYPELSIAGAYVIGVNTPEIFEIINLPDGATVEWLTSETGAIISSKATDYSKVEITFKSKGNKTITAKVRYVSSGMTMLEKSVVVGDAPTVTIIGPEVVFAGDSVSYTYEYNGPTLPPGSISVPYWSIQGPATLHNDNFYPSAEITFNKRGIVTLKIRFGQATATRTIYVEGKVDPEKMIINMTGKNGPVEGTSPFPWLIGYTGVGNINGIETTDQPWILERSWRCNGLEIFSGTATPASNSIRIKITDNSNYYSGRPSYQSRITYVLRYESIRGGVKQSSKTLIINLDDQIPYIEVQAPSTGMKSGQQYTIRVHYPNLTLINPTPYSLRVSEAPTGSYTIENATIKDTFYFTPNQAGWFTLEAYQNIRPFPQGSSQPATLASKRVYVNP